MRVEIAAIAATVVVGAGAGWWLAGPRDNLPGPERATAAPLLDSKFEKAAPNAAESAASAQIDREQVKDEALAAGNGFLANPCAAAYRQRWIEAYTAYMHGWAEGRGADGETGPDWKSAKDDRIADAFNAIKSHGLITDDEMIEILGGVSREGAAEMMAAPRTERPPSLSDRPGCDRQGAAPRV